MTPIYNVPHMIVPVNAAISINQSKFAEILIFLWHTTIYIVLLFKLESGIRYDKCSDVYLGPKAFSEIETRNIRDFVKSLSPTPILCHGFHAYSEVCFNLKISYNCN